MDEKKICFILCVNDAFYFQEMQLYLRQLVMPKGMTAEVYPVYDAQSMTSGYNQGMYQNDAKYKIYLHQDLFILKRDILLNLLEIFQGDSKIGMIGMAGCVKLPSSAVWWMGDKRYGNISSKVTAEETHDVLFGIVEGKYAEVEAVDGIFMATQDDLRWRQDLFTGWHFYDTSQSEEFQRAGYKIVVPRQTVPWVMHVCGNTLLGENYAQYQEIFLSEYKSQKVSDS